MNYFFMAIFYLHTIYFNISCEDLQTLLNKKIKIEKRVYNINELLRILEEELKIPIMLKAAGTHKFIFNDAEMISIEQIIKSILNLENSKIYFVLEKGTIKLMINLELKKLNEKEIKKEKKGVPAADLKILAPLKDVLKEIKELYGINQELEYSDKSIGDMIIKCMEDDITFYEFLEFLKNEYGVKYKEEKEKNKIVLYK